MNRFEQIKAQKHALDLEREIPGFARAGVASIAKDDVERLRLWGLALRQRTPGFFMLRVRIPAGRATAQQVRALGEIARSCGRNVADITTRAQLQLRWIQIQDVPAIFQRLREVGLASLQTLMDSVRNVVGCSLAGVSPYELFDATGVVGELEELVVGDRDAADLPRKMNISVSGCLCDCCHSRTQDVALVPALAEVGGRMAMGFNVLAGGKLSGGQCRVAQPLDIFVTAGQAAALAGQIVQIYHEHGPREQRGRSRLVHLIDQWGLARLRQELETRLGTSLLPAGREQTTQQHCQTVGIRPQKQPGLFSAGLHVAVGRLSGDQLIGLADLALEFGSGEVRFTAEQNAIITGIPAERLPALRQAPLLVELPCDPHPILRGTGSCTGAEYCSLALIETKQRAQEIAEELARRLPAAREVTIHWSGCRAGCGRHALADIGLVGRRMHIDDQTIDAADIYVGGSAGAQPRASVKIRDAVPCSELVDVLEELIRSGDFAAMADQASSAAEGSNGEGDDDAVVVGRIAPGGASVPPAQDLPPAQ